MFRLTHLVSISLVLFTTTPELDAQGGALLFDGVDDIASAIDAANDFDLAGAMTLEAWVRVDVAQTGGAFVGGTTAGGGASWTLGAGISNPNDGLISVSVPNTDAVFAPAAIQLGVWTHFAGTYDGTTQRIFVNGKSLVPRPPPRIKAIVFDKSMLFPYQYFSNRMVPGPAA